MGCGVSKFDLEESASPTLEAKLVTGRNKNRRAINAYSPLAKKPSLEEYGKEEDIIVEANYHGRKSVSLTAKDRMFVKETNVKDRNSKKVGSEDVSANVVASGGDNEEGEEDGHSNEEERVGEDSILFPGSPSFREYCADDTHNGKNNAGNGAKSEKQSQKEGFLNRDKGSRTSQSSAKSGRRGRGIRNVLHRGGFSGVKK